MIRGDQRLVRPSLGSWLMRGMGSINEKRSAFIALCRGGMPDGSAWNWQSAYLPARTTDIVSTGRIWIQPVISMLSGVFGKKRVMRIELTTAGLGSQRSTTELHPRTTF